MYLVVGINNRFFSTYTLLTFHTIISFGIYIHTISYVYTYWYLVWFLTYVFLFLVRIQNVTQFSIFGFFNPTNVRIYFWKNYAIFIFRSNSWNTYIYFFQKLNINNPNYMIKAKVSFCSNIDSNKLKIGKCCDFIIL